MTTSSDARDPRTRVKQHGCRVSEDVPLGHLVRVVVKKHSQRKRKLAANIIQKTRPCRVRLTRRKVCRVPSTKRRTRILFFLGKEEPEVAAGGLSLPVYQREYDDLCVGYVPILYAPLCSEMLIHFSLLGARYEETLATTLRDPDAYPGGNVPVRTRNTYTGADGEEIGYGEAYVSGFLPNSVPPRTPFMGITNTDRRLSSDLWDTLGRVSSDMTVRGEATRIALQLEWQSYLTARRKAYGTKLRPGESIAVARYRNDPRPPLPLQNSPLRTRENELMEFRHFAWQVRHATVPTDRTEEAMRGIFTGDLAERGIVGADVQETIWQRERLAHVNTFCTLNEEPSIHLKKFVDIAKYGVGTDIRRQPFIQAEVNRLVKVSKILKRELSACVSPAAALRLGAWRWAVEKQMSRLKKATDETLLSELK